MGILAAIVDIYHQCCENMGIELKLMTPIAIFYGDICDLEVGILD